MLGKVMAKNMFFNGRVITFVVKHAKTTIYRADVHLDGYKTTHSRLSATEKFDAICSKVLDMAAEESGYNRAVLKPTDVTWEVKGGYND